jgi:hypothetical protein
MPNQFLVVVGSATGIGTISADVANGIGSAVPATVTLLADYTLANPRPVGFPTRPSFTGSLTPEYPGQVVTSGTTVRVLECEAVALVNAGAAVLVSAGS